MPRLLSLLAVPLAIVAALFVGMLLGGHPGVLPGPVRNLVVEDDRALRAEVIESIEDNFNGEVDRRRLEQSSVSGIVRSLGDPYSHYFSPREADRFDQASRGQFEGIGVSVEPARRGLRILTVFERTPAERAGLEQGDVITAVDGDSVAGEAVQAATAKITGKPGTSVTLSVAGHSGPERTVRVRRARIEVPPATSRIETEEGTKLGVLELSQFTPGVHGVLKRELDELRAQGARGVVLDLRGNPGGLLDEAVLVSSQFIEEGVIVSTKGRKRRERVFRAEGDASAAEIPLVVLVDRSSASASEIVTGALRDRERAVVVGERTFGKGVFQEVDELSNGGAVSLTAGSYYLPNGENISRRGIRPSVPARDDPDTRRDEALPVALDTLLARVR
jgi:carboxyl-terminal processing protease